MANASWDPYHASLPGTHMSVIDDILRWIPDTASVAGSHVQGIYVLVSEPRCGKSSVSHRIAQMMRDQGRLGSAIFLAHDVEGRNSSKTIFSTMAYDLAAFNGKIEEAISCAIRKEPSLPTAPIGRQFCELIVMPIRDLTVIGPVFILIDGVDNLRDENDRQHFLRVLFDESAHLPSNFRILITARPGPDIDAALQRINHYHRRHMLFDDSGDTRDVRNHIQDAVSKLSANCLGEHSIDAVLGQLIKRSMEIHFWATTTCKFLTTASEGDATLFIARLLSEPLPQTPNDAMDYLYDALLQTLSAQSPVLFNTGWQVLFPASINVECTSISGAKSHFPAAITVDSHPVDVLHAVGCIILSSWIARAPITPSFQSIHHGQKTVHR